MCNGKLNMLNMLLQATVTCACSSQLATLSCFCDKNAGLSLENVLEFCKLLVCCKVKMKNQSRCPCTTKECGFASSNYYALNVGHSTTKKTFPCVLSKSTIELQAYKGEKRNNTKQNISLDACLELVWASDTQRSFTNGSRVESTGTIRLCNCPALYQCRRNAHKHTRLRSDKTGPNPECYAARLALDSPQYLQI